MKRIKEFFSITQPKYHFNFFDLTAFITILNVLFILMGYWWAPIFGLANCTICIIYYIIINAYINNYITQIALIILNLYFLKLI